MPKSVRDILLMKNSKKITVITAYDYTISQLCDKAGVDILLVGDSAGMVMLGYDNTIPVTMDQMCLFTEAVSRGRQNALVVADMPFMSYQASKSQAIENAGRLIKSGADSVKLEGGIEIKDTIHAIVEIGIPVMGHIGFQPQTTTLQEGYKVQAKTRDTAIRLIDSAKALEEAGVFSIALEMVTREVSKIISDTISIPTIGIGSGPDCDGQVLVVHDALGLYEKIKPKFAKRYLELSSEIVQAIGSYKSDVVSGKFPGLEHSFSIDKSELERLKKELE
ncbi:MAG: 3-methyl-2-oxobutanoate hydroxymethyltransferase [Thaumarchaeota archaeon]|nr:3-methyl-2-oxobutanoate hydroxymethyltransferase [Nitrososphaerota archaeon]MDE1831156.1 3-methyl-2-oxobutanoate hydroxymethyltransferase [Nitrososphaerota archaeon]MDE1841338.1 3-methyl-2-oxobutanoate hydroxymethyltransferase [Nitrososphaerota archaeon]MDE1878571.1 3-methyl-2-oxobutanoate hydroxymethyltransferase [Nitrososphaerota archaeon]